MVMVRINKICLTPQEDDHSFAQVISSAADSKTGDTVRRGQLLLRFGIDLITGKGCKTVTPVVVIDGDDIGIKNLTPNKGRPAK